VGKYIDLTGCVLGVQFDGLTPQPKP